MCSSDLKLKIPGVNLLKKIGNLKSFLTWKKTSNGIIYFRITLKNYIISYQNFGWGDRK